MPNIQVNTAEPTSMINNNDDKNMSSTSLGGSSPVINLDLQKKSFGLPNDIKPHIQKPDYSKHKPKENDITTETGLTEKIPGLENIPKPEEKPKEQEEQTTQGEYEQSLQNLNKDLDRQQEELKEIENILDKKGPAMLNQLQKDMGFNKYYEWKAEQEAKSREINGRFNLQAHQKYVEEQAKNYYNNLLKEKNNQIINTRNNINDIMSNDKYDDRTPEQKREDTGYQRQYQDMLKAGYNPASFSGGGGGGVGGSSARDEEEKRKKKKKEAEERKAAAQAAKQRQIMQMLGMVMGVGGIMGSGAMRNIGMVKSADIRTQGQMDVAKLRSQDNQLNNIYKEQMNNKNLDYRYNTIKYKTYDKKRKTSNEYYNYKD